MSTLNWGKTCKNPVLTPRQLMTISEKMDHTPPGLPAVLSTPVPTLTFADHKNFLPRLLNVHLFLGFLWDLAAGLRIETSDS